MIPDSEPTDSERYPTLSEEGAAMLRFLREHPHAPIYRNQSGNRLEQGDLERVRAFEREVESSQVRVRQGDPPWLGDLIARCFRDVPFYRRQGAAPKRLEEIDSIDRGDLARDIASFVPDDVDLERLINFRTTGTTGQPLLIASHPVVAAGYLALHQRAFRRFGVELRHRRGQVGVVLLGFQRECFTYVSVTPTRDESGLAKINLHPDDWRDPDDRARYLEALAPEVLAGDPISFSELLRLGVRLRPRVLLSTSMHLTAGLAQALRLRFECPVLDVYSLNEAGPIAVYDPRAQGHVLLQHSMLVEVLAEDDQPVPDGERGEVTLTGGFNFCLPLLRYRTGDSARLGRYGDEPVLFELDGRAPVLFRTRSGSWINNIDVTHALAPFAIAQFALHQHVDGALTLRVGGFFGSESDLRSRILELFGPDQPLDLQTKVDFEDKILQYTSELET
jgi:phenylacetate-CoA ligase